MQVKTLRPCRDSWQPCAMNARGQIISLAPSIHEYREIWNAEAVKKRDRSMASR
jgi:hypothetical protein